MITTQMMVEFSQIMFTLHPSYVPRQLDVIIKFTNTIKENLN